MRIFMPSRGRAHASGTYDNLPQKLQAITEVVVPHEEVADYRRLHPEWQLIACRKSGINRVRQEILERWPEEHIVMIDDDLRFATRREDEPSKFRDSTLDEIEDAFKDIDEWLVSSPHVGIATREGGNRDLSEYKGNTRILRVLAYDTSVLTDRQIRFDRIEVMEDFDVALQLLELGYSNVCLNWIVHDQGSSNAPGGCSTYRTPEVQERSAHRLKALHPDFVDVVQKTTKTAWGGGTRTDVRIQWKAAYAYGQSQATRILDNGTREGSATERD